jgi:hypothetical protein
VVPICNPSTSELKQENHKLEVGLGYIVRPCPKKPKARMIR